MKKILKLLVLACFATWMITFTGCKKEEPAKLAVVSTTPVTNITTTTAASGGRIASDGGALITASGVCWGIAANPATSDSKTTDGAGTGQFVSEITGLTTGLTYHVRAYATNSVGTAYGYDFVFVTIGLAPSGVTEPVTNISTTGATLNGIVNANYLSTAVTFEYGPTTNYGSTITASKSPLTGDTVTSVSVSITGLTLGTTYHFRVKAVNELGTTYGADMSFSSLSPANLPTLSTTAVSSILFNSAVSGGIISSDGGAPITAKGVCWGTTANPTIELSLITNDGIGTGTFISDFEGVLLSFTTYYLRAYATNRVGTTYGNQISFTTLTSPPTNGLVANYPLNGNANDASGNGYNGIVTGTTLTKDRFGISNRAFHFSGSDIITTNFDGILGNADRTISFWVSIDPQETGGYPCSFGGGGSAFGTGFYPAIFPANEARLDIGDATVAYTAAKVNENGWHFYVYIFSTQYGTSLNGVRIYQDGVLLTKIQGSTNYNAYTIDTKQLVKFSMGNNGTGTSLNASLDDVRVYNRVLTNDEIQQLYWEGQGY
jgi:Concanavalin A-like lectin/glucanases superfamily